MSKKKDADIRLRVTKEFKSRVQAVADAEDLDVSDIARLALKRYLEVRETEPEYRLPVRKKKK